MEDRVTVSIELQLDSSAARIADLDDILGDYR